MSLNGTGAKGNRETRGAEGLKSGQKVWQNAVLMALIALMIGLIKMGISVFGGENGGSERKRYCVVVETVGK